MKTAAENLLDAIKSHGGWVASGDMQRWEIRNRDGTFATPRTLVRRAEELVQDGKLDVEYRGKNHAHYRVTQKAYKTIKRVIFDEATHTARLVEVVVWNP